LAVDVFDLAAGRHDRDETRDRLDDQAKGLLTGSESRIVPHIPILGLRRLSHHCRETSRALLAAPRANRPDCPMRTTTYGWRHICRSHGGNRVTNTMLKITRSTASGTTALTLSGRIASEHLADLRRLVQDSGEADLVLDLREVTLVDLDAVRFLVECETQ